MKDLTKLKLIAIAWMFAWFSHMDAHAESYGTSDKRQHKIYSAVGTVALYPVARYNDVEYPKATAAGTMFAVGVAKEFFDNTPASGKDVVANAIGIGVGVGLLYGGELIL